MDCLFPDSEGGLACRVTECYFWAWELDTCMTFILFDDSETLGFMDFLSALMHLVRNRGGVKIQEESSNLVV